MRSLAAHGKTCIEKMKMKMKRKESNRNTYLGFLWDLQSRTVALPDNKWEKYVAAVEAWEREPRHTLCKVQKLYGKLLHTTLIISEGCVYLINLETMLSGFSNRPFVPHIPPRHTSSDLNW